MRVGLIQREESEVLDRYYVAQPRIIIKNDKKLGKPLSINTLFSIIYPGKTRALRKVYPYQDTPGNILPLSGEHQMKTVPGLSLLFPLSIGWIALLMVTLVVGAIALLHVLSPREDREVSKAREVSGWSCLFLCWVCSALTLWIFSVMECLPVDSGGHYCRMESWEALDDYLLMDFHYFYFVVLSTGALLALSPPKSLRVFTFLLVGLLITDLATLIAVT